MSGSAQRSLLQQLSEDSELSYAHAIIANARPGTRCHELRQRLSGAGRGRHLTVLVPVNAAVEKLVKAKGMTPDVFCKMPEAAELLAGHAMEDDWPLAQLRMLGTPLETLRGESMQLAFLPTGERRVSAKLVSSGDRPVELRGDIACSNGLMHKIGKMLVPAPAKGWTVSTSLADIRKRHFDSVQEMYKARMEVNGKTGPQRIVGELNKAVEKRRTASHLFDRRRAEAFAPFYGADYEPRVYSGTKELPEHRDRSHLRIREEAVPRDKTKPSVQPTLEEVWEEWEPLKREEVKLSAELERFRDHLNSQEAVLAEHAALVREVLPGAKLSWTHAPQQAIMTGQLFSESDCQRLRSCLSRQDPLLIETEVRVGGRLLPANSRLCERVPPDGARLPATFTIIMPEAMPGGSAFPLWKAPEAEELPKGLETRPHLEASLLLEQVADHLQPSEPLESPGTELEKLCAGIAGQDESASLEAVLSWLEKQGVQWGLPERWRVARFFEAADATAPAMSPEREGMSGQEKHPQESEWSSLFQLRIKKKSLAAFLNMPRLPEEHHELQSFVGHLRHLAADLRTGKTSQRLEQEVNSLAAELEVLRGRLEVLESSLPSPWSPPVATWQELLGTTPPALSPEALLPLVRDVLSDARSKAMQRSEQAAVSAEALRANADSLSRQVLWAESQAAAKEAEADVLQAELQEQAQHLRDLEMERAQGEKRARAKQALAVEEATRQADALAQQRSAAKVQQVWRRRREMAQRRMRAVLLLQFFVRRWRRKRQLAARKIQARWSNLRRVPRRMQGAVSSGVSLIGRGIQSAVGRKNRAFGGDLVYGYGVPAKASQRSVKSDCRWQKKVYFDSKTSTLRPEIAIHSGASQYTAQPASSMCMARCSLKKRHVFAGLLSMSWWADCNTQELDMPCTSLQCPTGYLQRWDAVSTFCAGACNSSDAEMCCFRKGFASHSWRIVASSPVGEAWDLAALRFYLAENCSADSLIEAVPSSRRGGANGAAFSYHRGRGAVAADLFHEPVQFPSSVPQLQSVRWSSGAPCTAGECFVGFSWESDSTRTPVGNCRQTRGCPTVGFVRQAGAFRVACAEVEQSQDSGFFAESLRLQMLDVDGRDSNSSEAGLWRTAAEARNLDLAVDLDMDEAFVPGLRRGFAIVPVTPRSGEPDIDFRRRIRESLKAIRAAKLVTGQRDQGGERYFWAAMSESPERRRRAQFAGKAKRLVLEKEGDKGILDVEFGTGNLWYNGVRFASAVSTAPLGATTAGAGWIHLPSLARQLGVTEHSLTEKWDEIRKPLN
eukprot:s1097_g20.t2